MHLYFRACNDETIEPDEPGQLGGRRVCGSRVAQQYGQARIVQPCVVQRHDAFIKIYTMGTYAEPSHAAMYLHVAHEVERVDVGLTDGKLVYHDLFLQ